MSYCDRLHIPVPDVDELAGRPRLKLFHLVVAALLENGQPMSVDELTERLKRAGVHVVTGDLRLAIQRAWAGREPVFKDNLGRYALDLQSQELDWIVRMELQVDKPRETIVVPPPPAVLTPGDDVPLTVQELEMAFQDGYVHSLVPVRVAGAVLEALGSPMTVDAINHFLRPFSPHRAIVSDEGLKKGAHTGLIRRDQEGQVHLIPESKYLKPVRAQVRKWAKVRMERQFEQRRSQAIREQRSAQQTAQFAQEVAASARLKRAVITVFPDDGPVRAAALLNWQERTIETFLGDEVAQLVELLPFFGVIAAPDVHGTLERLGGSHWEGWLMDLCPPKKTKRLDGRTVKITPDLVLAATLGRSKPLGEPGLLKKYANTAQWAQLRRRLISDVEAFAALYDYGILHGFICFAWGGWEAEMGVNWGLACDPALQDYLWQSEATGMPVDVVLGNAPRGADPWVQAKRLKVDRVDHDGFWTAGGWVGFGEVQQIRMADGRLPERRKRMRLW